jgi:hypothetical protein
METNVFIAYEAQPCKIQKRNLLFERARPGLSHWLAALVFCCISFLSVAQIDATFIPLPPECPDLLGGICCNNITGGVPPYTCQLQDGLGNVVGNVDTNNPNCFINVPVGGPYQVIITDIMGTTGSAVGFLGASAIAPYVVVENVTPASCGNSNGQICCTVSGGSGSYTYMWIRESPVVILGTGTLSAGGTLCISGQPAGDYTFIIDDANNNCGKIYSIILPQVNLSLSGTSVNSDCVFPSCNGSIDITPVGTAPYTYSWTGTGGFTASTQDLSGLCPGTYNVSVTDANGCVGTQSFTIALTGADVINAGIGIANNTISGNVVWNPAAFGGQTQIVVDANVVVLTGATLTINNLDVRVTPSHSIRANARGLIVGNNSIFDAICGDTWRGFEILGSGQNSLLANRGVLRLTDCTVTHAECGARNYEPNYPSFATTSNTGGQIHCVNTTFTDNVYDLNIQKFVPPTGGSTNFSALFTNCNFLINTIPFNRETAFNSNPTINTTNISRNGRIQLNQTSDIRFANCRLENLNAFYAAPDQRMVGVYSTYTNFIWEGTDVGDNWLLTNYLSIVRGFRRGFDIREEGLLADNIMLGATINNTLFRCHQGISELGRVSSRIENNLFLNYNMPGFVHVTGVGAGNFNPMYAIRSGYIWDINRFAQPFRVAHNRIEDAQTALNYTGVELLGTGDISNFIIENYFKGCTIGLRLGNCNRFDIPMPNSDLDGNNTDDVFDGLHYECNDFDSNINDVKIERSSVITITGTSYPLANRGVSSRQSRFFAPQNVSLSAGNNFTASVNAIVRDDIDAEFSSSITQMPQHNYIYSTVEFTNGPVEMTSPWHAPIPVFPNFTNQCNYQWRNTSIALSPQIIQSARQSMENKKAEWSNLVDGGITNQLLTEVGAANYSNALALYQSLLQKSPALSEEVMVEAIQQEYNLPAAMLVQVLASNPQAAKNSEVWKSLEERSNPLTEQQIAQIKTGLTWFSAKENMEAQIMAYQSEIVQAQMDLLSGLNGMADAKTIALNAFDAEASLSELKMKADLLMRTGSVAEGIELMHSIASRKAMTADEQLALNTYLQMLEIQYTALMAQDGVLNTTQIALLESIYNNNTGNQGGFANELLHVFLNYELNETYFESDGPGENRNMEIVSEKSTLPAEIVIWPNPSTNFINARFVGMQYGTMDYKITSIDGRILQKGEVNSDLGEVLVTLENIPTGHYMISFADRLGNHNFTLPLIIE